MVIRASGQLVPGLVSIVVPTHDRPDTLAAALASIRALEGPDLTLEILVADNSRTGSGQQVAAEHGARWIATESSGASGSRNAGMGAATGEFLAFLDDDDLYLPGTLRPQLALLRTRTDLDAVVGQVQLAKMDATRYGNPYPSSLPDDVFPSFLRQYPQIGATMVRTAVRESVGLFDTTLVGGQDWDWQLRLATKHRVGFVAVPAVLFRQREVGDRDDLWWIRLRFMRRVFWKNARAAGWRRAGGLGVFLIILRHRGEFADYFMRSAIQAGQGQAARLALWRAARSSWLHVLFRLCHDPRLRQAMWGSLGGSNPPPEPMPKSNSHTRDPR